VLGGGEVPDFLRTASKGHGTGLAVEDGFGRGVFLMFVALAFDMRLIMTQILASNIAQLAVQRLHVSYFLVVKLRS
jgi:hypothetical protein